MKKNSRTWVEKGKPGSRAIIDGERFISPFPPTCPADLERLPTDGNGRYYSGPYEGFKMSLNFQNFRTTPTTWTLEEWREHDGKKWRAWDRDSLAFKSEKAAKDWLKGVCNG